MFSEGQKILNKAIELIYNQMKMDGTHEQLPLILHMIEMGFMRDGELTPEYIAMAKKIQQEQNTPKIYTGHTTVTRPNVDLKGIQGLSSTDFE